MKKSESLLVGISGLLLMLIYHMIFSQYFPNNNGNLGHDYALFLPKLLDGYFWYHTNGLFALPWFTPAFCGGIPLMPDPQSIYYSVPQFISFVTDPLTSVYLTFLGFAGLGFAGFYLLLRKVFHTTRWAALLGAGFFLFNGFYAHRMIIGHLTYHPFMLIPLLAFMLLRQARQGNNVARKQLAFDIVVSGLLLAYMFHAGMVNVILPAIGSVIALGLICNVLHQRQSQFWLRLALAGSLALGLSSAKLVAAMAYLRHFARDGYTLPGAPSVVEAAALVFRSLFIGPAHELAHEILVNRQWVLDRHEFEYGITFIPLLLLIIGGAAVVYQCRMQGARYQLHPWQWLQVSGIAGLLCLPILLNYYTPVWNAALKHVPILKNSSTLIRWVCLYIPIVILLMSLAVEKAVLLRRYQPYVVMLCLTLLVALNAGTDRGYYHSEIYNPQEVVSTYRKVRMGAWTPAISHVTVLAASPNTGELFGANDVMTQGGSQFLCYEPLFGYKLEAYPFKALHPGPVMAENQGFLNLKNPACYVYPSANSCEPGDHFSVNHRQAAEAFIHYRPFAFRLPVWQKAVNVLNLFTATSVIAFLISRGFVSLRRLVVEQKRAQTVWQG